MSERNEAKLKAKVRSPSYPGIGLERAVDCARKIYEREYLHPVAWEIAVKHLGLSSTSSASRVITSAMKKFGLLDMQGEEVRLTETAIEIIHPDPDEPQKSLEALRVAALRPGIYREIWDKYNHRLPTDESLRYYLERGRGFNPSAIRSFIRDFRETVAYARLERPEADGKSGGFVNGALGADHSEDDADIFEENGAAAPHFGVSAHPSQISMVAAGSNPVSPQPLLLILPLRNGGTVDLRFSHKVSSDEFSRIVKMIEFSEPAFVETD